MKKLIVFIFTTLLFSFLSGCYNGNEKDFLEAVEVNELNITSIYLEATTTATLEQGQVEPITAMATVSSGSDIEISDRVNWSVSDSSIATISSDGELTGLSDGIISVTATLADLDGSLDFTVSSDTLVSIEIVGAPASADECSTGYQLTANGDYTLGTETPGTDIRNINSLVTWSSGTEATAIISEDGIVTALSFDATGTSEISAMHDGITGTVDFNVDDTLLAITLDPLTAQVQEGKTQQFTAMGEYGANQVDVTNIVTWSIANSDGNTTANASISATGLVTGINVGESDVSATCGGAEATTVTAAPVSIIDIDDLRIEAQVAPPYELSDDTLQLRAILVLSDGSDGEDVTDDEDITWSITSGDAATVSNDENEEGLVTFVSTGDVVIRARWAPEDDFAQSAEFDLTIQ